MASYTIVVSDQQETGLDFSFENYAAEGQTKEQFLQERVNFSVLNVMFVDYKNAQTVALQKSLATIPEANEAKAVAEMQAVVTNNGGHVVSPGPPNPPPGGGPPFIPPGPSQ